MQSPWRIAMTPIPAPPRKPRKAPDQLSIKLLGFHADARGLFSIVATVLIFLVLVWAGYFSLKPLYMYLGLA
jgi:hypothetical protein